MNHMNHQSIRRLRKALKLSQEKFALLLGVSRRAVVRWEKGENKPHPSFIEKMKELSHGTV